MKRTIIVLAVSLTLSSQCSAGRFRPMLDSLDVWNADTLAISGDSACVALEYWDSDNPPSYTQIDTVIVHRAAPVIPPPPPPTERERVRDWLIRAGCDVKHKWRILK